LDASLDARTSPSGLLAAHPASRQGAAIALLVAVATLTRLPGLVRGAAYNVDESTTATVSMVMGSGGHLYQDVVDRKPPVLPLLFWGVERLTGTLDLRPVRVLALLAIVATTVLLASEARRRFELRAPTGVLAAAAVVMFTLLPSPDTQSVAFETIAVLPATIAFVLAARGRTTGGAVAAAVATLCKQTFLLGLAPVLVHSYRRGGWARVARDGAVFVGCVLAGGSLFGFDRFFYWTFVEAGGYATGGGLSPARALLVTAGMCALLTGLLAGPLLLASGNGWTRLREQTDILVWLAGGVLAYVLGLRFLGHYAFQILPPLSLLALGGFTRAGTRRVAGITLTVATTAVWLGLAFSTPTKKDQGYQAVAGYVKATTEPWQRVFVWGASTELYWRSDRLPASRFPHIQFLTALTPQVGSGATVDYGAKQKEWADLWGDFALHPPSVILDSTTVDGGDLLRAPIVASPLWSYLTEHYRAAGRIDGVQVWLRIPDPPTATRAA